MMVKMKIKNMIMEIRIIIQKMMITLKMKVKSGQRTTLQKKNQLKNNSAKKK